MEASQPSSLFEHLPIGVCRMAPTGRLLRANPALVRLHGCSSEAELLALATDFGRQGHVDPQRWQQYLTLMAEQGQVLQFESEVRRLGSGERIWVRESAYAVRDAQGTLLHFEGTVEDSTAQHLARQALQLSAQKFATAFAASPDCLIISRLSDGVYLEVNETFLRLSGYSRQALIGHSSVDLHIWRSADERAAFVAELKRLGRVRDFVAAYQGLGDRQGVVSISAELVDIDNLPCVLAISRDITDTLATQTALRESEARLRLALQSAGQGLFDVDLVTGEAIVNDEYARMLGHEPAQFHETNAAWLDRLHPDDRERVGRTFQDYLAGHLPEYRVEFRQRTRSGDWKWILSLGCLLEPAAPGQHRRILGTHTDLTQHKQAEQEAQQLLGRLERAEAIARMGSWEHDLLTGAVWWSAQMHVLVGSRDGEGPTEDLRHLHPDDREAALDCMRRAIAQRQPQRVMVRSNPKRGPLRWFSASGLCEVDEQDRPRKLSGTLIDVTALKQAEQALLRLNSELEQRVAERTRQLATSERRYRRIFESVPVAIQQQDWTAAIAMLAPLREVPAAERAAWLAERPTLLTRCLGAIAVVEMNPMAHQLYGIPEADRLFTTLADVFALNGRTEGFVDEVLALVAGERRYTATRSVRRPDGGQSEVLVSLAFPGPDEHDGAVLVSIADITEIQRLSTALDASLARATRANRELETFTYSVSHDLKAPLRGLDGYSQLLLRHHADALDAEGRSFLHNIHTATLQMGQLIDDLLAYSRLERQTQDLARLPLAPLVSHVLTGCRDELSRRGIVPQLDLADIAVLADAAGLSLALRNLVDNALKFTSRSEHPRLSIRAQVTDTAVQLSVQDNGIGFDMKLHDRIFQIFQRLQRAEDYPGTGVGLAIVSKAMERMGGHCWAESRPGEGATFHLQLPRAP